MTDAPDAELLEQFARNRSEPAFAALVERHIALVHSVALRHTANPQHAEDITQAVFIILAHKAATLGGKTVLPGWLYHTARLTAANLQRAEMRRIHREQEAFMQSTPETSATDDPWHELSPQLDAAMAGLGAGERDALVLRFFQNKSMAEVGKSLGLEENTAQKRVGRALEKLRKFLTKQGVTSTTAGIAEMISAHSIHAAPVALAKTVTAVAIAKGAAASGSTLTLIKGALKIMAWTKAKTAIIAGTVVLLAAGTATVTVQLVEQHKADNSWRVPGFNSRVLDRVSPQVRILPSKIPNGSWGSGQHGKKMGTGVTFDSVLLSAYDWWNPGRTICLVEEPPDKYDYIASLSKGNAEALQELVKQQFGIIASRQVVETNVFVLTIKTPNTSGLSQSADQSGNGESDSSGLGQLKCQQVTLSDLGRYLEEYVKIPIIDRTGLTKRFDINLTWPQSNWGEVNLNALKQALSNQLGLELVPSREPVEMLVVEKAK